MGKIMANWVCPYCNHAQSETDNLSHKEVRTLFLTKHKYAELGMQTISRACANDKCGEVTIQAQLYEGGETWHDKFNTYTIRQGRKIDSWLLRPQSSAKPLPEYIPVAIQEDYYECCKIRDLSPKASATLARRCLQGMIRDFCGITQNRLIDEIKELEQREADGKAPPGVNPETIEALHAIRKVGNIGAHMEKDISTIIDVAPGEAQKLIELVEMLLEDWYVARNKRQERLAVVKGVAAKAGRAAVPKQPSQEDSA